MKNKEFEPEITEKCFLLYNDGDIRQVSHSPFKRERFFQNNLFKTEKEAMHEKNVRYALVKLKKYLYENNLIFIPDWNNNNQEKIYICLDAIKQVFITKNETDVVLTIPYFKNKNDAQKVIDNCKKELKILYNIK